MTTSTVSSIAAGLVCLVLHTPLVHAAETPETILIRKTMANDISGYRRADAELVLSAYREDFVALDGNGNADPRAWTVRHEALEDHVDALRQDLERVKYETDRTLPFIHVRGEYAMVTSQDSGRVVNRATGAATDVHKRRFWILRKTEEDWLISTMVDDLGDSLQAPGPLPAAAPEITELLLEEAADWTSSSPGGVLDLYAERFVGLDAYATYRPETWKIIFGGAEEFGSFLEHRLDATDYSLDRQVLSTRISTGGQEAIAVTQESVRAAHAAGDVVHELERNVLWTLSRRSGSWQVTAMCYDIALAD